jgi:hypothetical protein
MQGYRIQMSYEGQSHDKLDFVYFVVAIEAGVDILAQIRCNILLLELRLYLLL